MHGIYISSKRPKSKKEVKEAITNTPKRVYLQDTTGREFDGHVQNAPVGEYTFVGPDPYLRRNWYGTITVHTDGRITVK